MFKKISVIIIISFLINNLSYSAGASGGAEFDQSKTTLKQNNEC